MNIIKSIKGIINSGSGKKSIVERLLLNNHITVEEATILLSGQTIVNIKIDDLDISSGARVIAGDDNSTDYR